VFLKLTVSQSPYVSGTTPFDYENRVTVDQKVLPLLSMSS